MDHKENMSKWIEMGFSKANKRQCIKKLLWEEGASTKLSKAKGLIEQAIAFKKKTEGHADSPAFKDALQATAERPDVEVAQIINEMTHEPSALQSNERGLAGSSIPEDPKTP